MQTDKDVQLKMLKESYIVADQLEDEIPLGQILKAKEKSRTTVTLASGVTITRKRVVDDVMVERWEEKGRGTFLVKRMGRTCSRV